MALFVKAWTISSSWEGAWRNSPEKGSADEEYVYGAFWGTNNGLTGKYIKEFAGWTANRRAEFQKLTATQCGEIWQKTRWRWMQGDKIENQDIASLIFDWYVMRNQKAIQGVVRAIDATLTPQNWMKSRYVTAYKNTAVGGKPAFSTDGFYGLSDAAIQALNNGNQLEIFNRIKLFRNMLSPTGTASIKHRYATFVFNDSKTKEAYCSVTNCNDGRQSLIVNNQPHLDETNSDNDTSMVEMGLLFFFGAKLLKIF
jgi:Glycosyl hydrolase 108